MSATARCTFPWELRAHVPAAPRSLPAAAAARPCCSAALPQRPAALRRSGRGGRGSPAAAAASDAAPSVSDPPKQLDRAKLDGAIERAVRRLGGMTNSTDMDEEELQAAIHRAIDEEVHTAFEVEMSHAKEDIRLAVDAALHDAPMKFDVTANVNTLMAITAVISYWRGVGGLLDILLEDSLEGYVACVAFGLGVIGMIRLLKLPVVEGNGLGF